ncbi:MAG: Crp/Fnr family transcriptional regulator [Chitinophagaceae bacterium]|jgi:CRP-like cAMP-binding protein|nr:Crp/Fnr family transcriptional regulator [Chitinophagaceae bacterium]
MNRFSFTEYLTSNAGLDASLVSSLVSSCQTKQYKSGDYLLREGERSLHSFFIEKGLAKMYGIDSRGKEHILQFAPEGWFVADRESAYFQKPATCFIQAIEDTSVLLIDEAHILEMARANPGFLEFNNKLLHNHIRHLNNRIYQLLSATAEERYLSFIKTYPDILLRVPQIMVASYLGITPESLSRVRKDLAGKHAAR